MIASADGCPAGWVVAITEHWPALAPPHLAVCRDFATVLAVTAGCAVVVVDIPIGLPADGQSRTCDERAKQELGAKASSVFYAPPRSLLTSTTHKDFSDRHRGQFNGDGISIQAFGLVEKLRELEVVMTPAWQTRVREFHPELVWQRLAGRPLPKKREREGREARWDLLRSLVAGREELTAWRKRAGSALKEDDLLDALVGLDLGHRLATNPARATCLPGNPPRDERGLRMEIWF
ncbi:MAG: DUF429 domain-containing protein [Verrucomicrobiae bacterium]|nr:DUF429 domain-containing protein [Verrucomicrobiae bacterium]